MTEMRKKISVVVPAYNEEMNIVPFTEAVRKVLDPSPYDYEVLFVDDGSTDSTLLRIQELTRADSRIGAIGLSRNFGSHSAISAGLKFAGGDATIVMAVDLQDDPAVILEFIRKWEEGYEVVWGVRRRRDDPKMRQFWSTLYYRILRKIALPEYPSQGTGSFCLISGQVRKEVAGLSESNAVVFGLISWAGFRQAKVFYDRPRRQRGGSKWNFGRRVKAGIDSLAAHSYVPLRLSSYLGLFFVALSGVIILYIFFDWLIRRNVQRGWPTLMISIYFVGGVQMMLLGILGEYLWRISQDVKRRPQFIVRRKVGFCEEADVDPKTLPKGTVG